MNINFPEKKLLLDFEDRSYEVKFPNTAALMKIFSMFSKLTNGQARNMISDFESFYVVTLAEMESHFTHIMPKEFWDDFKLRSISDLDAIDSAKFVDVFVKQYKPWFKSWMEILMNGGKMLQEEVEKEDKKDENTPRLG